MLRRCLDGSDNLGGTVDGKQDGVQMKKGRSRIGLVDKIMKTWKMSDFGAEWGRGGRTRAHTLGK